MNVKRWSQMISKACETLNQGASMYAHQASNEEEQDDACDTEFGFLLRLWLLL